MYDSSSSYHLFKSAFYDHSILIYANLSFVANSFYWLVKWLILGHMIAIVLVTWLPLPCTCIPNLHWNCEVPHKVEDVQPVGALKLGLVLLLFYFVSSLHFTNLIVHEPE